MKEIHSKYSRAINCFYKTWMYFHSTQPLVGTVSPVRKCGKASLAPFGRGEGLINLRLPPPNCNRSLSTLPPFSCAGISSVHLFHSMTQSFSFWQPVFWTRDNNNQIFCVIHRRANSSLCFLRLENEAYCFRMHWARMVHNLSGSQYLIYIVFPFYQRRRGWGTRPPQRGAGQKCRAAGMGLIWVFSPPYWCSWSDCMLPAVVHLALPERTGGQNKDSGFPQVVKAI